MHQQHSDRSRALAPGRWRGPGLFLGALALLGLPAGAQQGRIEDLEQRIEALEAEQEAEREALNRQLDEVLRQLEVVRAEAGTSGQATNVFNPAISVSGTFTGRDDNMPAYEDDDPGEHRVDDRFSLREAEVDLRSPVGPWADGVLTIAFEDEGGEYEVEIEEGYVLLRRLPLVEAAPGGLQIKAGRFRPNFNRLNRVHLHNLPQPTYPRSLQTFLGYHGFVQNGVSGQFFLPTPGDSVSLQGTVEFLNGGDVPPQSTASTTDTGVLGQLRTFAELTTASTFDLGVSAWSDGSERSIYGVDATYAWVPPGQSTWQSFILGGELFLGDFDQFGLDEDPMGYHVYAQYQFNTSTYAGVRYDRSQELDDASLETDIYGAYITRYAAEFLRFRLGFERANSDLGVVDGRETAFLEVSFIYGAHPTEPYWVHK